MSDVEEQANDDINSASYLDDLDMEAMIVHPFMHETAEHVANTPTWPQSDEEYFLLTDETEANKDGDQGLAEIAGMSADDLFISEDSPHDEPSPSNMMSKNKIWLKKSLMDKSILATQLDLSDWNLYSEDALEISELLQGNASIADVNLSNNYIGFRKAPQAAAQAES